MLKRPRHPLPRQFRRRVSPQTRTFVRRRHARARKHKTERLRRSLRRTQAVVRDVGLFVRRWSLLAVGALVLVLIGVGLFSPLFQIREISIQRTQGRVDVRQVISVLTPLYNQHMLFINERDVHESLAAIFPDLDSVKVSKAYPHKLVVRVTLKPVVARLMIQGSKTDAQATPQKTASGAGFFNGAEVAVGSVQQYDYLTENGIYVSTPAAQTGSNLLTLNIVDWAVRPVPGTPLVSPEFLQDIRDTEAALSEQFGQKTRGRTVYLRADEYHLDMGGYSLWFDRKSSLEDTFKRYRLFLQAVGLKEVKSYVDLRLNGRVVYR